MKTQKIIFLLFLFTLFSNLSFAQGRVYSINTKAGKIRVESTAGTLGCSIKLNKKVILYDDVCDFSPRLLQHYKKPVFPFSEVLVFQDRMLGNACDGASVFILGIKENGNYTISDPIEYCGGPKPIVTIVSDKVTITLPKFISRGNDRIAKEVWVYEKEKLVKQKQPRKRK